MKSGYWEKQEKQEMRDPHIMDKISIEFQQNTENYLFFKECKDIKNVKKKNTYNNSIFDSDSFPNFIQYVFMANYFSLWCTTKTRFALQDKMYAK